MSWWRTIIDRVQNTKNRLQAGMERIRNNSTLANITARTKKFFANTKTQFYKQGIALIRSMPTLINPDVLRVTRGAVYLLHKDILPMMGLHYINNESQKWVQEHYGAREGYSNLIFICTLAHYGVQAFIFRQGVQTTVRILILDSVGPAAFNSEGSKVIKEELAKMLVSPRNSCEECSQMRFLTGMMKEPLILLTYELLTYGLSKSPLDLAKLIKLVSLIYYGRYIIRIATPANCERHKKMMQESVFALGLSYMLSVELLDSILISTTGLPPALQLRALHHLLLLLQNNIAAHMVIPETKEGQGTIPFDFFNKYEASWRFYFDVLGAGLKVQLAKNKTRNPLATLIPIVNRLSFLFNLDKENRVLTNTQKIAHKLYLMGMPTILHSSKSFVRDPMMAPYWPALREGTLSGIRYIEGKNTAINVTGRIPGVASVLRYKFGVPKSITRMIIAGSKTDDVWACIKAVELWLERTQNFYEVTLVSISTMPALRGTIAPQAPTERKESKAAEIPAYQLLATDDPILALLLSRQQRASSSSPISMATNSNSSSSITTAPTFFAVKEPQPNEVTTTLVRRRGRADPTFLGGGLIRSNKDTSLSVEDSLDDYIMA